MKKNDKMILVISALGTVAILGMAFVDRWLYPGDLPPGMGEDITQAQVASSDAQGDESQVAAMNNGELPSDAILFMIASSQSEVRFTLNEVLGGEPTIVLGKTNQVSGEIWTVVGSPEGTQIGEILIDAGSFATDNTFRNRAIQNKILESGKYATISFIPTQIALLPDAIGFGESIELEISGDLTIKDVTQQITFIATITQVSATEIEGHAEVILAYADFGINIPSVPRVAEVDEEVLLEIDFVALTATE